jgi:hypothetical protein
MPDQGDSKKKKKNITIVSHSRLISLDGGVDRVQILVESSKLFKLQYVHVMSVSLQKQVAFFNLLF